MSYPTGSGHYNVEARYADLLKSAGLGDAMSVFENPNIQVWRSITERENCVLDLENTRLHIKRNKPGYRGADDDVAGIKLLTESGITTVPLAGYGQLHDGRGFVITEHLHGFEDCERLLEGGLSFEKLLEPTARLAGRLHQTRLHHRDLYINHFYVNLDVEPIALCLVDPGRVARLPRWFARRWLVKDVAQFVFSLRGNNVPEAQIQQWLAAYQQASGTQLTPGFRSAVERKVRWIDRHDQRLRRKDPTRNVAIDR